MDKAGSRSFYESDGSQSAISNGRRTKKKEKQSQSIDSSLEGVMMAMPIGDAMDVSESSIGENTGPYGPISHSRGRYRRISVTSRQSINSSPRDSLVDERVQHLEQQLESVIGRQANMEKLAENMVGRIKCTLDNITSCQTQQDRMIINQNAALLEMKNMAGKLNETTIFNQTQIQRHAEIMEHRRNMSISIQELTKGAFHQTALRQMSHEEETLHLREPLRLMREENLNRQIPPKSFGPSERQRSKNNGPNGPDHINRKAEPITNTHSSVTMHSPPTLAYGGPNEFPSMINENFPVNTNGLNSQPEIEIKEEPRAPNPSPPGLTPSQPMAATSVGIHSIVVDACPPFTPGSYSNWRREVRLWITSHEGIPITNLLAKLIMILPASIRVDAMTYMEETENSTQLTHDPSTRYSGY